ncbi:hypothetical protein FVF58_30505 [Paraburkholderia panacisoli]|uniref:Restriction endonuclease n=1 Tax=Paraburkholderia panacisoli TaxID=2603818 RepID=A0A5B0GQH5_9BURK|nr:hypothetical protein [Paraburkholderia panacisoli]KAA1004850.1 hypothetical protein FVF58_30505 [Paraburkholderia panacisoli]
MTQPVDLYLRPPKGPGQFESIVRTCAKLRWGTKDFVFNGRQGQRQKGVDVYGDDEKGRLIGVQAKNTPKRITMAMIRTEIRKAETFRPPLNHYWIGTSADTDETIQEEVRLLSGWRKARGLFTVQVVFWEGLHDLLCDDEDAVRKHFGIHGVQGLAGPDARLVKDRNRFDELQAALPHTTVLEFAEHDFRHPFPYKPVTTLHKFLHGWRTIATAFYDESLREAFSGLYSACNKLSEELGDRASFYGKAADRIWVVPEQNRRQPDVNDRADAKALNRLAAAFARAYEDYFTLCRTTLYC